MNIETGELSRFNSVSIKVPTTAGTMFVAIMEDALGNPVGFQLNIGKAGSELSAFVNALSRVCNLAIDRGALITDLIQELSNHTTDKRAARAGNGSEIRSVVDGIVYALVEYNRERYANKLRVIGDVSPRLGG